MRPLDQELCYLKTIFRDSTFGLISACFTKSKIDVASLASDFMLILQTSKEDSSIDRISKIGLYQYGT